MKNFDTFGIPKEKRPVLIAKIESGQLLDSENPDMVDLGVRFPKTTLMQKDINTKKLEIHIQMVLSK